MTHESPVQAPGRPAGASPPFTQEAYAMLLAQVGAVANPCLKLPSLGRARELMATTGGRAELGEFLERRKRRIELAALDPLYWSFEPATWADSDRLLTECVILGIFGGNRAAKTWYAVNRAVQLADLCPGSMVMILAELLPASVAGVQNLVWNLIKPKYGHLNGKRDAIYRITHSGHNGFDRLLILPNGSQIHFLTYNQNPGDYEGLEWGAPPAVYERVKAERAKLGLPMPPNVAAVADESMPILWLQMLTRRAPFRHAKVLWAFTPVRGITPAIKELVGKSARTLVSKRAELLPRRNLPDLPEGHMPYIQECSYAAGKAAGVKALAIYFFTEFNPFGPMPGETYYMAVKKGCAGKDSAYIERVAYGYARDSVMRAHPKFGAWNIISRRDLPAEGVNVQVIDPAGTRRWATLWARVARGNPASIYIYRDWPDAQRYGEWAVPTERETNTNTVAGWDGDPGPAQMGTGMGILAYKKLWLELERITVPPQLSTGALNVGAWEHGLLEAQAEKLIEDPYRRRIVLRAIRRGEDLTKLTEGVAERYIDSRAGASEHMAEQGGTCIIYEFAEQQRDEKTGTITGPAMDLALATGIRIEDRITRVNQLLDWNETEKWCPVLNQAQLFVCADCLQVIWMLENYTSAGGEKGACKDFADLVQYLACADLEYYEPGQALVRKGGGW